MPQLAVTEVVEEFAHLGHRHTYGIIICATPTEESLKWEKKMQNYDIFICVIRGIGWNLFNSGIKYMHIEIYVYAYMYI